MSEYILEMKNISKEFTGVKALTDVSFKVEEGEIHCLIGENGAGKSTLMKVLSGVYPHGTYSGDIVYEGNVQQFGRISDSVKAGIAIIYQELALFPDLTVSQAERSHLHSGPGNHPSRWTHHLHARCIEGRNNRKRDYQKHGRSRDRRHLSEENEQEIRR
ncbi:ATP-binding cassette domain-containing protein [Paenibacillus sp. MCAF20]